MRISILLVASYNPYFLPTIKQLLYAQLIRPFSIWLKLLLDNWALRHTLLAIKNKQIKNSKPNTCSRDSSSLSFNVLSF